MKDRELAELCFNEAARLTADSPGITRASYSDKESALLKNLSLIAKDMGLLACDDCVGNLWFYSSNAVLMTKGYDEYVLTGSHVDSVAHGGNYDGLAGVVAGMLAVRRCGSRVRAIALRGEEGAWFGQPYKGSKALFGKLSRSADLMAAMQRQYILDHNYNTKGAGVDISKIRAFVELHIEQGPALSNWEVPVAAVTSIAGNVRYKVVVTGVAGHSGTTPMSMRSDAVRAAVRILDFMHSYADTVTCGVLHTDATTEAVTRIPERCEFQIECRGPHRRMLDDFDTALRMRAESVSVREVQVQVDLVSRSEPVVLDETVFQTTLLACDNGHQLMSGAGHDAAVFQECGIPSGMIFVRNTGGSHNPSEHMEMDDFMIGVDTLEATLRELVKR